MKISITYLYTIFKYGYPPTVEDDFKALADIEAMGFHYLEMEGLGPEHTEQVWRRRQELKQAMDDHHVQVHNFCGVDPDLVSLDDGLRRAAYERFKRTAELGVYLGATTLHLASYAPPVEYLNGAPYQLNEDYKFADTFRVRIPEGFNWQRVWEVLVESCRRTAEIAGQYDRTIIMEPRVGEVICSVDSMLRLIADVGMPNFKANFDTGHFSAQRENIPLALMKLEGRFANIHVSDNNPADTNHLPPGEGTIDWDEFFRILKVQRYDGYLGLDLGNRPSLVADLAKSVQVLKQAAGAQGIALES
ncbi:MAG: sugar phosphate isomerase/epimerase family protein [Phycisphaeraceae bacterium]